MILRNKNKEDNNYYAEQNNKNSWFINILNQFNEYKIIIIILTIAILVPIILLFTMNSSKESTTEVKNYLTLKGEGIITIYRGTDYIEPGYNAYNSKKEDLSTFVEIESTLNTEKIGTYEIIYILYDITVTRTINVIANPNEQLTIVLNAPSEKEETDVYLLIGNEYIEPGYKVIDIFGNETQTEVTITGTIDTSKVGIYELTYSLIDPNEHLISVTRKVVITDIQITLSQAPEDYTNQNVTINIKVEDDYFDYLELPNKEKTKDKEYNYTVNDNATYTFIVYNTKGLTKSSSIDIQNIDKVAPTGSCSGSYKDGVSTVNISASDNVKVKNYKINNQYYTNNTIILNEELPQITITISDIAGNTNNVSCTLEDKNEFIMSDKSITFSYQYVSQNTPIPYALYTPSTASKRKQTPLIIWLHGSGEVGQSKSKFKNSGLLQILNSWEKDGFNAYVLCPHLASGTGMTEWKDETVKTKLDELLEKIIKEYKIDQSKIVISGHSLGAIGAEYLTYKKPKYFSAMVILSGYYNEHRQKIKDTGIPVLGFVGGPQVEHEYSYNYMMGDFAWTYGKENVTMYFSAYHGQVPEMAFNEDKNNDNKSDLIEWMLTQTNNY